MSVVEARAALEVQLATVAGALDTAYENADFTPKNGVAYQSAHVLFARPENPTLGDDYHRLQGIFQVTLFYPIGTGSRDAYDMAELIKAAFNRGSTFTSGTTTVKINRTPNISVARTEEDRFAVPIDIPFHADIF